MVQHDWMTADPAKVMTIHDLASSTNASIYSKNTSTTAGFAKPVKWPFSRLAFSDEDFETSSFTLMRKEIRNKVTSVLLLALL
jgi:hypothetical protein